MTFKRLTRGLALALLLTPVAAPAADQAAGTKPATMQDDEFSEANQLLFLQDHLTQIAYPARYVYARVRSGSADDFEDRITMTTHNLPDSDAKHVAFSQTQTEPGQQIDDVENARGNPLIMVFLQSDVLELAEATGGHWRYFQKQMKLALENTAQVEPITVTFQGKPVDGRRISVKPYADDPERRQALGRYVGKTYEFILSDQVPGSIVELRTSVPAEGNAGEPQVERLTLQSMEEIDIQG